jgi:hypothetical protein
VLENARSGPILWIPELLRQAGLRPAPQAAAHSGEALRAVEHAGFTDARPYFAHIADVCRDGHVDYLARTIFSRNEMYATTGEFTDAAPYDSDYTCLRVYYKSIRKRTTDYLTASNVQRFIEIQPVNSGEEFVQPSHQPSM